MYGTRAWLDAMNLRAGKEDPLFALLGGDLAYANGSDGGRWRVWLDSWNKCAVAPDGRLIPMVVAIGNHEVKGYQYRPTDAPGREDAPFFYSLFSGKSEGANFTVDFGDYLSLVGVDSGHTANVAAQTQWLGRVLGNRVDVPRQFVCYHRPAWGTGVKGDATDIRRNGPPFSSNSRWIVFLRMITIPTSGLIPSSGVSVMKRMGCFTWVTGRGE